MAGSRALYLSTRASSSQRVVHEGALLARLAADAPPVRRGFREAAVDAYFCVYSSSGSATGSRSDRSGMSPRASAVCNPSGVFVTGTGVPSGAYHVTMPGSGLGFGAG